MTRRFPQSITTGATSLARRGSPDALYAPSEPVSVERSHTDFVSAPSDGAHEAWVRWPEPVALSHIAVQWRPGWIPREAEVFVEVAGADRPSRVSVGTNGGATADRFELGDRAVTGVVVVQAPGGGSVANPRVLRIAALTPVPRSPALPAISVVRFDGTERTPELPTWCDDDPQTCLDIGDAQRLLIDGPADSSQRVLRLDIPRIGRNGDVDMVRAWAGMAGLVRVDGKSVAVERFVSAVAAGRVAGTVSFALRFDAPLVDRSVEVDVPFAQPFALGLSRVTWCDGLDAADELVQERSAAATKRPWADDWRAEPCAMSLGVAGTTARVGVAPDGILELRGPGGPADCIHIATTVDGVLTPAVGWRRMTSMGGRVLHRWIDMDVGRVQQRIAVDNEPHPTLVIGTGWLPAADFDAARVGVAAARRLWLNPRPVFGQSSGGLSEWTSEHRIDAASELTVTVDLRPAALIAEQPSVIVAAASDWPPLQPDASPAVDQPEALRDRLLATSGSFIGSDGAMRYGAWPSLYAEDLFGLEEPWLIEALAMWGRDAWPLYRTTMLRPEVLATGHYLHELRIGLLPWQTERVLALTGRTGADLDADERALVRAAAEEIAQRIGHRPEDDTVWPGLMPPGRYGGDVGFTTQNVCTDAACLVGLAAASRLLDDESLRDAATRYEADLRRVATELVGQNPLRLHNTDDEPGDYQALLAAGLFDAVSAFAADDPIAVAVDRDLEASGALRKGLPRFDGWGGGDCVDPHYGVGYLLNCLWRRERARFHTGLDALVHRALDPVSWSFREVTAMRPVGTKPAARLPGRCLSWAAPCVGGVGVTLLLLRHARVTEVPPGGGRPGGELHVMSGAPPAWWAIPFDESLPTFAGPVRLRVIPDGDHTRVLVEAPPDANVTVFGPADEVCALPAGGGDVRFARRP